MEIQHGLLYFPKNLFIGISVFQFHLRTFDDLDFPSKSYVLLQFSNFLKNANQIFLLNIFLQTLNSIIQYNISFIKIYIANMLR